MKKKFLGLALAVFFLSIPVHAEPEIIFEQNEIEKLKDLDPKSEIYLHSKPTGRLELPGLFGINDYCTLSLISVNEAITAGHCLQKRNPAKMRAFFEYYSKTKKNLNPHLVKQIKYLNPTTDIAILELEGKPGLHYGFYSLATSIPPANSPMVVYEHPGLDEKSVSRKNCFLKKAENGMLFHTCDTENYSSGSPILNLNFELVGIHQGSEINETSEINYGRIYLLSPPR